jgi:alpha-mannosidase
MNLLDENGRAVPFHVEEYSENISRALQLVFTATGVPSLGYRTYYLVAADQPEAFAKTSSLKLDRENDLRDPRRPHGADVVENESMRLTIDRATGRVSLFDKSLNRDLVRDMEVAAVEERGGNYIGVEPVSGRTILALVDDVVVEENNAVRTVVKLALRIGDTPIEQRLTLYSGLKRLDIENTVDWKSQRFLRFQQVFHLAQEKPELHYGIPFGANAATNIVPNAGTHARDEIPMDDWRHSRQIHEWVHAGYGQWGLTIAADHQQIRFEDGLIRAEMLRGVKFTSVKVVRGEKVGSMEYPIPGKYVFRYSLSAAPGDFRVAKAYHAGMGLTNPLLPVSVVDDITQKSLPPTSSFCSVKQDSVVVSTLKKAEDGPALLLRVYDMEGANVETPISFLGKGTAFSEVNLLEEDVPGAKASVLKAPAHSIRTLKLETPAASR